jgi:hypothetical protein
MAQDYSSKVCCRTPRNPVPGGIDEFQMDFRQPESEKPLTAGRVTQSDASNSAHYNR